MFDYMIHFFDSNIFKIISGAITLITLIPMIVIAFLSSKGALKILYRLGFALATHKIAIFAESDTYSYLCSLLIDNELIKQKNLKQINHGAIKSAESCQLYLVHWAKFEQDFEQIIATASDKTPIIIYVPQGRIPDEKTQYLTSKHRHIIIVNFEGRLLNDVLVSLIYS